MQLGSIPIVLTDAAVKSHTRELISLGVCTVSLISATQEQALWWAQMVSYGVGMTAGCFAIWSIWKKRNQR